MSKHNYKKSRLKHVFLAFTCATAFAFSGIAAACGNNDSSDTDTDKTTSKEDTQLLKNGNFEFFTIPEKKENGNEPVYLIKSVDNWTHGGTTSSAMSGIISTSKTAWAKMTDEELADKLDYNNKLDSSSSDYLSTYVDYNGMASKDILYKDQYYALKAEDDLTDEEKEDENRLSTIENPGTHYNVTEKDGKYYTDGGDGDEVFVDDNGEYFLKYDADKDEYSEPISNVLMLHNYATSHNGIAQNYSSVEIELPANTAAEISVWVKTSYLKYLKGTEVEQDRGANISVTQTVGSATLDKFAITSINTEKLVDEGAENYNGWVEYTVYINACDFASTKIKLELGLGETGYLTEGYAFFDDVSVTKYISLDDSENYNADKANLNEGNQCNLSSDASEKIFIADSSEETTADGKETDERSSKDFCYLIDLASEQGDNKYNAVSFATVNNLKTGYTVDSDNYVSSTDAYAGNKLGFGSVESADTTRKPFNNSIDTSKDLLAYVTTGHTFNSSETPYYEKLNEALKGASDLPKNSENYSNNMLVMLSAYGAAYTTSFDLSIPREGYQIISFWVKTSDMGGSTAATVSVKTDDDNVSKFTLDTTDKVTNIGDTDEEKDIYNGWVQCFFFVKNELEKDGTKTADNVTVEFSFGNTTIKGTEVHSYKNGWVALANMQTLDVSEEIFSYAGSGDTTASLTISEETDPKPQVFDEAYANQSNEIKTDAVIPSSYLGVNGGSSAVVNNGFVSIPFDEFNNNTDDNGNTFTGLINKEYFTDSDNPYRNNSWYKYLIENFSSSLDALTAWNEIFGQKSIQPLILNNRTRTSYVIMKGATEDTYTNYFIKDDDGNFVHVTDEEFDENETYYSEKQVMNYGYIGADSEVSANSYATVSVRVKVSANAIAYVYLVDTSAERKVLSYTAPSYSFYYDAEGNVLKAEPKENATNKEQRENILYTLRTDGLYEDSEGNLYANLYNYKKLYYENITYYDAMGENSFNIDELVDGETYYNEDGTEADHYLVTSSGIKVFRCLNEKYYYIVEGKTQTNEVKPFDTKYARYDFSGISEDYMVEIVGSEHTDTNGVPQWVTVTFVIHAGSEAKSYRLELWSGNREEYFTDGNEENGTVIFDYSYDTISDDDAKSEYEQDIIDQYLKVLPDEALKGTETTGKNIAYYEKLAEDYNVDVESIKANYTAHYYTYSLYDSAEFIPFNQDVASDGATGYDYNVADQSETLSYLQIKGNNEYTVFADYSVIDQTISLNNPDDSTTDDSTDDSSSSSDGSIWLLASSIILVIALVFAIIAIFLKDVIKKARRNKVTSKNNYDHRKANRYKRKLRLNNEEIVEVDANNTANDVNEEVVPETIEETPSENVDGETAEETPVEENAGDTEEAPAEENPDNNGEQE